MNGDGSPIAGNACWRLVIIKRFCAWIQCVDGATAVEYGLLAGGVSLTLISLIFAFGDDLHFFFEQILISMDAAVARANSTG